MLFQVWMVVQILLENLPVSSSGHVALLLTIAERYGCNMPLNADLLAFDFMLQGVSALLFLIFFFRSWWQLIIKKPIRIGALFDLEVLKKIVPVLIFGFLVDAITTAIWMLDLPTRIHPPLAAGFAVTAVVLWCLQYAKEGENEDLWAPKYGFILGCVQGLTLMPGLSRFGLTFSTLRFLGYKKDDAFSISFLVQWPLIAAGSLKGYLELRKNFVLYEKLFSASSLFVMVMAGIVAYGLLFLVKKVIDRDLLWRFSYYMLIPTAIALIL